MSNKQIALIALVVALAAGAGGLLGNSWSYAQSEGGGPPQESWNKTSCRISFAKDMDVCIRGQYGQPGTDPKICAENLRQMMQLCEELPDR